MLGAGSAHAQWDRHERIKVTPISRNGKPGFRLGLTLVPTGTYPRARVGLGKLTTQKLDSSGDVLRLLAAGARPGYLLARLPEIKGLKNRPVEVEHEFIYGEGAGKSLAPGMKIEVVSTFTGNASYSTTIGSKKFPYYHVFGMLYGPANQGDVSNVITLPAPKKKAQK